ncbi:MAG: hypothetical protein RR547_03705 [Raoultibacter sp.]
MKPTKSNTKAVVLSLVIVLLLVGVAVAVVGLTAAPASTVTSFESGDYDYFALQAAQASKDAEAKIKAEAKRVADAEQAAQAAKEAEAQKAKDAEAVAQQQSERTIDTPYYTIVLPESWLGDFEYQYDDSYDKTDGTGDNGVVLGLGYVTSVKRLSTNEHFQVVCYSDSYGPQGRFYSKNLGALSMLPGHHVAVVTSIDPIAGEVSAQDREALLGEYASYVTVK